MDSRPILVTGPTGYVGGRLVPRLLETGYRVRAVGRSPAKLRCRPWSGHPNLEIAQADMLDPAAMTRAAQGCRAGYYLVHSMNPATKDYAATDRRAAEVMAAAAESGGLERIIYLGGIIPRGEKLSHHLASRAEVGRILQAGPVPATWLKAAMILGAGSASFELLRYLADRLPLMITPRWVTTRVQPIAVSQVLEYLVGCLETDQVLGQALDIGGPEITTYAELFQLYARLAGLPRRLILPVPVLTPQLSSLWIHLVTPVNAALARPLAEGLSNEVIVTDDRIRAMIPHREVTCRAAIGRALERIAQQRVVSCWTDAGQAVPPEWVQCGDAPYAGGTVRETAHRVRLKATPEEVWPVIGALGGRTGWYFGDRLWRLRGFFDTLAGGVGSRRGRRHPTEVVTGDTLDFWRVLEARPPERLLLLAEMKVPGEAVLELRIEPRGPDQTELQLIARFLPRGLSGILYWEAHATMHRLLYHGMLRGMAEAVGRPLISPPREFDPGPVQACSL